MARVGGRQAGTPNKNKAFLRKTLRDRFGEDFDAVVKAAECAAKIHEIAMKTKDVDKLKTAVDAWDKVAQYVEPKLKAVEIDLSNSDGTLRPQQILLRAAEPVAVKEEPEAE